MRPNLSIYHDDFESELQGTDKCSKMSGIGVKHLIEDVQSGIRDNGRTQADDAKKHLVG